MLEFTVKLSKVEEAAFERFLDDYWVIHRCRYPMALETAKMKVRQAMVQALTGENDA